MQVQLRAEDGEILSRMDMTQDFWTLLKSGATEHSAILKFVDPYVDTVVNRIQAVALLADLEKLERRDDLTTDQRSALELLRKLAERCRDGIHEALVFFGE